LYSTGHRSCNSYLSLTDSSTAVRHDAASLLGLLELPIVVHMSTMTYTLLTCLMPAQWYNIVYCFKASQWIAFWNLKFKQSLTTFSTCKVVNWCLATTSTSKGLPQWQKQVVCEPSKVLEVYFVYGVFHRCSINNYTICVLSQSGPYTNTIRV